MRNLRYFISEGIRSFFANGLMSLTSVTINVACLFMFGMYVLFSMNISYVGKQFQSQYEIRVFMDINTSETRINEIGNQLRAMSNISKCDFMSRGDFFELQRDSATDERTKRMFEGLDRDNNPFRNLYIVTLKDLEEGEATINAISSIPEAETRNSAIDTMVGFTRFMKSVQRICLYIMLFLAGISVFIIANTIMLTVFARRKDINIMKFVGATNWFIRWPFIVEGIAVGVVGAVITMTFVMQLYIYILKPVNEFLLIYELQPWNQVAIPLGFALIGFGMILGAGGSVISVRKHLKV